MRKKEAERQRSLDIERWLKSKFREGFTQMKANFEKADEKKIGMVNSLTLRTYLPIAFGVFFYIFYTQFRCLYLIFGHPVSGFSWCLLKSLEGIRFKSWEMSPVRVFVSVQHRTNTNRSSLPRIFTHLPRQKRRGDATQDPHQPKTRVRILQILLAGTLNKNIWWVKSIVF